MTVKLMSDERQEQLMKAAEATVQLMNVGVDGNAALAKIAADNMMNDHEIDLITHAVNNSRQLAHLQSSSPEDKEKPFPLIDGARVKAIKPEPWTNAEQNSGRRYNLQETPTPNGEAKADAPDAVGIQRNIMEGTNAKEKAEPGDYHVRPRVNHLEVLNREWGIPNKAEDLPEYKTAHVWADFQREQYKQAELRIAFTKIQDELGMGLDAFAEQFRRLDAPKFAQVEAASLYAGVDAELINLVYNHAELEKFNEPRAGAVKQASGRMYVANNVAAMVVEFQRLGELIKAGSAAWAALPKVADEEDEGGRKQQSPKGSGGGGKSTLSFSGDFNPDIISGTMQDTLGLGESPVDTMRDMLGHTQEGEPQRAQLGAAAQGEINRADSQIQLKQLMGDPFISGHSLPEVVDAYNAALSVNPGFGDTELKSYIRQHLATKGGVPFDLQLRAAQNRDNGDNR